MFCKNCGSEIADNAAVCVNCGAAVETEPVASDKKKVVAALLAFFLGALGIHNFYLGHKKKAIIQLVLTIVGGLTAAIGIGFVFTGAVGIWAFVEFIMILIGKIGDAEGKPLA